MATAILFHTRKSTIHAYSGCKEIIRATLGNIAQHWAYIWKSDVKYTEWQIDEKYSLQPYLFVVKYIRTKEVFSRAFSIGSNMNSLKVKTISNSLYLWKLNKTNKTRSPKLKRNIYRLEKKVVFWRFSIVFYLCNGNRNSYPSHYYKLNWLAIFRIIKMDLFFSHFFLVINRTWATLDDWQ